MYKRQGHVAATIEAIRARTPHVGVEALISDMRGDAGSLAVVFDARPDVLNHNIESVARWWRPDEFRRLKAVGEALGIPHVEASPLTRSSYHARQAAGALTPTTT